MATVANSCRLWGNKNGNRSRVVSVTLTGFTAGLPRNKLCPVPIFWDFTSNEGLLQYAYKKIGFTHWIIIAQIKLLVLNNRQSRAFLKQGKEAEREFYNIIAFNSSFLIVIQNLNTYIILVKVSLVKNWNTYYFIWASVFFGSHFTDYHQSVILCKVSQYLK